LDDGLEVELILIDAPHSPLHLSPWRAGGLVDQATLIAEGASMISYLHLLGKIAKLTIKTPFSGPF
jgi:hypothetical protein